MEREVRRYGKELANTKSLLRLLRQCKIIDVAQLVSETLYTPVRRRLCQSEFYMSLYIVQLLRDMLCPRDVPG